MLEHNTCPMCFMFRETFEICVLTLAERLVPSGAFAILLCRGEPMKPVDSTHAEHQLDRKRHATEDAQSHGRFLH